MFELFASPYLSNYICKCIIIHGLQMRRSRYDFNFLIRYLLADVLFLSVA